jgi:hypothetical protein
MYWGYDAKSKEFRTHFFDKNGPFDDEGSRYTGVIADGKLTFTGPARFQYELDSDGKIKVNPDGTITIVWWLRDDAGNWVPWTNNTFVRVA